MSRVPLVPGVPGPSGEQNVPGSHPDTGQRIAAAAFELFAARGYDGTTVDAIAERAGIARRTFFRYFRSKDDVIFPDHDSLLAMVNQHLTAQTALDPIETICGAVRLVLLSYLDAPAVSVQRYELSRRVPALRERELASVQRYEHAFSRYLRGRLSGTLPDAQAVLRSDVIAAAVVAAHNAVLREWLRAGGDYDPVADLDAACGWVLGTFGAGPTATGATVTRTTEDDEEPATRPAGDVVVAVFRSGQSMDDVVAQISRSLGDRPVRSGPATRRRP
ncbi:TetR family transcriptional regulator [Kineosporia sp. J2-2]|uniref:TetR family transcriptional regulator n=1 Tax=Kineosporia corallincola TaxID=2835133 RepID=A0ABS5TAH5_9ACTN|nr:TetR family transcriptional regulator [Kineosporia corallincola]MBT0768067.1 TetR family transcriptional regulator [Kineosporia corallincola]